MAGPTPTPAEQQQAQQYIKEMSKILKMQNQHYQELMKYQEKQFKTEKRIRTFEEKKADIIKKATNAYERQLERQRKHAEAMAKSKDAAVSWMRTQKELQDLEKQRTTKTGAELDELNKKIEATKAVMAGYKTTRLEQRTLINEARKQEQEASQAKQQAEQEFAKHTTRLNTVVSKVTDKFAKTFTATGMLETAMNKLQSAVTTAYKQTVKRAETGTLFEQVQSNSVGGLIDWQINRSKAARRLGLSVEEQMELIKRNKQTINTLGGSTKAFATIGEIVGNTGAEMAAASPELQALKSRLGGAGAATKYVTDQMGLLTRSGIKPTLGALDALAPTMVKLQQNIGMTGDEFNSMMADFAEDEGIRAQLRRSIDERQRLQILKNTSALVANYTAMGMTKENAIRAAKALNKIAGETAITRMEKAAKFQALAGAMGIDSRTAALAAQYMRAPMAASAERKEAYARSRMTIGQTAGSVQGMGGGREMLVQQLMERTGFQELGVQSAEASSLTAEAAKQSQATIDRFAKESKETLSVVGESISLLERTIKTLQTPIGQLAQSIAALGVSMALMVGGSAVGSAAGAAAGAAMAKGGTIRAGGAAAAAVPVATIAAIVAAVVGVTAVGQSIWGMMTGKGADNFISDLSTKFFNPADWFKSDAEKKVRQMGWGKPSRQAADQAGQQKQKQDQKQRMQEREQKQKEIETQKVDNLSAVASRTGQTVELLTSIDKESKNHTELLKQVVTASSLAGQQGLSRIDVTKRLDYIKNSSAGYSYF